MLRFSHFAVATGHVPSTGNALTGSRSPLPASITAVTFWTKSGACSETSGGRSRLVLTASGTRTSCRCASAWSTTSQFRRTTSGPRLPYVFSIDFLMCAIASSWGSSPAMAKKQVCMIVLMRVPMPARFGQGVCVDSEEAKLLRDDRVLHLPRQVVPDLFGRERGVQQERRARRGMFEHVDLVHELELVAGDEPGTIHQIRRADRLRARCAGARW